MILLHNLKNIFHVLVIFQCLFFALYLLSQKNRKRRPNVILAAFLLAIAVIELGGVFRHFLDLRRYLTAHFPHVFYIDFPFPYLAAPLLYFYVLSMTRKNFRFNKVHLLNLVPFGFFSVFIILKYHLHGAETLRQMLEDGSAFSDRNGLVFAVIAYSQFLAYVGASLAALRSYRAGLKEAFSALEPINLSWLNFVLSGFLVVRSLEVVEYALWFITGDTRVVVLYYAAQIVFLVFLALMFFKGLKQPEIFAETEENNHRRKYEKALLSGEQKEEYARKLLRFMENEKPYLDPLLSLSDLARKAAIPPHHLSQVLNSHFRQNFFDFVNSYRIRESQQLLADLTNGNKTVLKILYETGFNSKSVFNTAFKKHTGVTPTEFRKQQGAKLN